MSDVATFAARTAARTFLAEIAANGGSLQRQPDEGDGLVRVLIEYGPGADWLRCRNLLAQAKADGPTWAAVLLILEREGATP